MGGNVRGVALNNTLTLGYLVPWKQGWVIGPYVGSSIILAIQEVKRRHLVGDYDIEWVMRDDHCQPQHGMQVGALKFIYRQNCEA